MIKVDIFSGFLGAGKTTLIKKLIKEAYAGEKIVLIENEFGEIGIDGGFMKEAGIEITEMNSGCICCSLVGDFGEALKKVIDELAPERILIEPSGVGKLSDVIKAVMDIDSKDVQLNAFTTVVDANKCKMYMKNFGEFFNNQIENASSVVLSHCGGLSDAKIETAVDLVRSLNPTATVISTVWDELDGKQILAAMENSDTLEAELKKLKEEHEHHHHHHDSEECDDPDCCCHHHHEHNEHEHEHHHEHGEECHCHEHAHHHEHEHEHHNEHDHHHHEHGEECHCHEQEHHHHHGEGECDDPHCHCHDHHGHEHHHHHADEVFSSWGTETPRKFNAKELEEKLAKLSDEESYGIILRAKGIVCGDDGKWIHFDYIPGKSDVRTGGAEVTGRLCVIGSKINEDAVKELFLD